VYIPHVAKVMHIPKIPIFRSLFLLMPCFVTYGVERLLSVEGTLHLLDALSLI
jgi:hypothetical protein